MANSKKIKRAYICPTCKGNGYLKFKLLFDEKNFIEQCHDCDSQGELYDYDDEGEITFHFDYNLSIH